MNYFYYPVNIINIRQEKTDSHMGLDLGWDSRLDKNSFNQDIINPFRGEVIYIKYQNSGGYVVQIYSKELNLTSEFGHLKKGSIKVKLHQIVGAGEVIAKMGATGKANGNHLHYGLYKGKLDYKKKNNFLDPLKYLVRYPDQTISGYSKDKLKIVQAKIARGIPSEPLLITKAKNWNKENILKNEGIYNGQPVPVYEDDGKFVLIDKIKKYYTSSRYV